MSDVTKDLLAALGDCLTFIEKRHSGNWVTQQARAAIARAEAALAEPQPDAGPAMSRDDVIRMAREAGFTWEPIGNIAGPLERLVEQARAEEREACVAIAKEAVEGATVSKYVTPSEARAARGMAAHLLDAIRARGQK